MMLVGWQEKMRWGWSKECWSLIGPRCWGVLSWHRIGSHWLEGAELVESAPGLAGQAGRWAQEHLEGAEPGLG